jgi:hypothetical protein
VRYVYEVTNEELSLQVFYSSLKKARIELELQAQALEQDGEIVVFEKDRLGFKVEGDRNKTTWIKKINIF